MSGDMTTEGVPTMYTNMTEEKLLTKHDVRAAFRRLPLIERTVVALLERYTVPPGYTGPWPPTPAQIGEYLGRTFPKFRGRTVPARTVVRLNRKALQHLHTWLTRGGRAYEL